jgi:hypothetical protein
MPRMFMNDTPEDHAAIQPALSQIQFYPLSQFDGKMKTRDCNKLPKVHRAGHPAKYSTAQLTWVDPATCSRWDRFRLLKPYLELSRPLRFRHSAKAGTYKPPSLGNGKDSAGKAAALGEAEQALTKVH